MNQGFYEQLGVDPSAPPQSIRAAYARVVADLRRQLKAALAQGGDPAPHELAAAQVEEAFRVLVDPTRRRRYDALRALRQGELPRDEEALWNRVAGALVPPAVASAAELLRVTTMLKMGALPPAPGERQAPTAPRPAPVEAAGPAAVERTLTHTERLTVVTQVPVTEVTQVEGARPRSVAKAGVGVAPKPTAPAQPAAAAARGGATTNASDFGFGSDEFDSEESLDEEDPSSGAVVSGRPSSPGARPSLKVVEGASSAPVLVMPPPGSGPRRARGPSPEDIERLVERFGYTGGLLRELRERRGVSLEEMAEATRIAARYLTAIEAEHYESLPSATFVRGYVREMARHLGLDEERVTTGYMRRFGP